MPSQVESAPHPGDLRRVIPGLLISLVALIILFYFVDLKKFGEALRLADKRFALLSLLTTLTWIVVRSRAWATILRDQAPVRWVFWAINQGYLLNNLLPFRLGEVGRAYLLSRRAGLEFWQVFSTILIERLIDLAFAVGLLFATLPFVIGASWAREAAVGSALVVAVGLGALFLFARNRPLAARVFGWFSLRFKFLRRLETSIVYPVLDGLAVLNEAGRFVRALGWLTLNWLLGILQYVLMMNAFIPSARFIWGAFTLGVAALGVAAPSSPGSVGVYEGAVVAALAIFNQDVSVALAFAITNHLVQIVLTGIFGVIALSREGETLLSLYQRLRRLAER
jgi:hypothetical protein